MSDIELPSQVECLICGYKAKGLYDHIKSQHGINKNDYRSQFPEACLNTDQIKVKANGGRRGWTGKKHSEETKKKLSLARKGKKFKPHSPETIIRMQDTWTKRKEDTETYEAYRKSISEAASTPERLAALRNTIAKSVKNGPHNGKAKDTKLEKRLQRFLTVRDIEFETQFILEGEVGAFTFDFYLPSMNLLVETDGEYWHKNQMVINRDRLKERLARDAGYAVARVSDKDWKPMVIFEPKDSQQALSEEILNKREKNLKLEEEMARFQSSDTLDNVYTKKTTPRKSMKGVPKSEEHKKNLSIARTGKKYGPQTPEAIANRVASFKESIARRKAAKAILGSEFFLPD